METKRQRLIKPITIVKVKKYLQQVSALISSGEQFSLHKIASENNISTNIATLMIQKGFVLLDADRKLTFNKSAFSCDKGTAVSLIEFDRVYKKENAHKKALQDSTITSVDNSPIKSTAINVNPDYKPKGDELPDIQLKSLTEPKIQSMMERALQNVQVHKQTDIFDGIKNTYQERFELAKAIASGVYSSNDNYELSKIKAINNSIVFAANDLLEQIISFKKPINEDE